MAIGLPGAGKSTYFARRGIVPLASDLVRQLLYDNAADQRHPERVFAILRELLRCRLASGMRTTYIDATNLTRHYRRPYFELARQFGCQAEALYFDVPLEICLARNRNPGDRNRGHGKQGRSRAVPEMALRCMAGELELPTRKEGFVRIRRVRPGLEKSHGKASCNKV